MTIFLEGGWKTGTLLLTNFQFIFKLNGGGLLQVPFTLIRGIGKKILVQDYSQIKLKMKDFRALKMCIQGANIAEIVHTTLMQYQHIDSITRLFAFDFKFPVSKRFDGWFNYDAVSEYNRMGKVKMSKIVHI